MENAEKLNGGKNLMAIMGFEPDKTIDIMMLINAKQLQTMAEKLLEHFPKTTPNGKKLNRALELLQQLKVKEAAILIEEITLFQKATPEQKILYDELIAEAKEFGETTLESLRNGVIPEYILQVPSISK